jgi:hypothetical protein
MRKKQNSPMRMWSVEGTLTLNYVKVRCVADIELETLNGTGHLVMLEEVHP